MSSDEHLFRLEANPGLTHEHERTRVGGSRPRPDPTTDRRRKFRRMKKNLLVLVSSVTQCLRLDVSWLKICGKNCGGLCWIVEAPGKRAASLKQRNLKVNHCPSTGAYVVRITKIGRTALSYYSVIRVVLGCIPFIKWEEMVV